MAADYQNAAPPVQGLNFQPPVPDNSMGPMQHVYIPRFDGGVASSQTPSFPALHPTVCGLPPQQQGYLVQPQPAYFPQPILANGQPGMPGPGVHFPHMPAATGGGGPANGGPPPFIAANTGPGPDVSGVGRTAGEEQMRQLNFAHSNKMFEPQDFKPSDDDPSRFYYVRELDGNWTQRNRFTIDHMGDCRWYVTDEGWFYAVRLPN